MLHLCSQLESKQALFQRKMGEKAGQRMISCGLKEESQSVFCGTLVLAHLEKYSSVETYVASKVQEESSAPGSREAVVSCDYQIMQRYSL